MRRIGLTVVVMVVQGCASQGGAQSASEDSVPGCYQFEWDSNTSELGLPWGFELLSDPLVGWDNLGDARAARTRVTELATRDHPFGYWRVVGGDTIQVGHPGGGGFALALLAEGHDLVGTARPLGDAVAFGEEFGPRPSKPVTARRVLCPAPGG